MDAKEQIRAGLMAFINEKPEDAKAAFNKALEIKMRAAMNNSANAAQTEVTPEVAPTPTNEDVDTGSTETE